MHTRFIRFAPLLLAAVAALIPATAFADKPVREGLPDSPVTLDASICGFGVHETTLTDKEFITTFSSGKQIVTGALTSTLTNDQTGKSITINISGPGTIVPNGDGTQTFSLKGRSLIWLFPNQLSEGSPGRLIWTSGPVVFHVDANFKVLSFDITSARVQDLCAALAS
jgi:hypothetical protein